jgi:hypothetical protein
MPFRETCLRNHKLSLNLVQNTRDQQKQKLDSLNKLRDYFELQI